MDFFIFLLRSTALALFSLLDIAMLLRALFSWFADEENRFLEFLYAVTEPVIMPVRLLCDRFGWFTDSPIDVPFLLTVILLAVLETALEML